MVYRPWEWVCYLPGRFRSFNGFLPLSRHILFFDFKIKQALAEYECNDTIQLHFMFFPIRDRPHMLFAMPLCYLPQPLRIAPAEGTCRIILFHTESFSLFASTDLHDFFDATSTI